MSWTEQLDKLKKQQQDEDEDEWPGLDGRTDGRTDRTKSLLARHRHSNRQTAINLKCLRRRRRRRNLYSDSSSGSVISGWMDGCLALQLSPIFLPRSLPLTRQPGQPRGLNGLLKSKYTAPSLISFNFSPCNKLKSKRNKRLVPINNTAGHSFIHSSWSAKTSSSQPASQLSIICIHLSPERTSKKWARWNI